MDFILVYFQSKNNDDVAIINVKEGSGKRERSSTKSKDKRDKSYDDVDVRKEKRISRKRNL